MNIGGGYILTEAQVNAWKAMPGSEYDDYVEAGLFDPDTYELYDAPEWMIDGDPKNGPFDFNLNPSHGTSGW